MKAVHKMKGMMFVAAVGLLSRNVCRNSKRKNEMMSQKNRGCSRHLCRL